MRRSFLYILIVSVVLSALLGIIALLQGSFGETEAKILLTTLCVAGASILSMACAAVLEKGGARGFAAPGIAFSILGFALFLVAIWTEFESNTLAKTAMTFTIAGIFCAHAALLLLARLAKRFQATQPATITATGLLGALIVFLMWGELDFDGAWRVVGILSILGCAGTILTAVFQRMSREERTSADAPAEAPACPHCGRELPRAFLDSL